jgi:hypothetical protein
MRTLWNFGAGWREDYGSAHQPDEVGAEPVARVQHKIRLEHCLGRSAKLGNGHILNKGDSRWLDRLLIQPACSELTSVGGSTRRGRPVRRLYTRSDNSAQYGG